jgi:hypothetical protein
MAGSVNMTARSCRFTTTDVSRAIRGFEKSGKCVGRLEITAKGSIVLTAQDMLLQPEVNEWDEVLEYEKALAA